MQDAYLLWATHAKRQVSLGISSPCFLDSRAGQQQLDRQMRESAHTSAAATTHGVSHATAEHAVQGGLRFVAPFLPEQQRQLYLLDVLDAVERSRTGAISMPGKQLTCVGSSKPVASRAEMLRLLENLQRRFSVTDSIKASTMKVRLFYVRWWATFCIEMFGVSPWIIPLEHMLTAFRDMVEEKYGASGCAAQAISHVDQFFMTVLRLARPTYTLLNNDQRMAARRKAKRDIQGTKGRKHRRAAVRRHLDGFCEFYARCSKSSRLLALCPPVAESALPAAALAETNKTFPFWQRVLFLVLSFIAAAGFYLRFRVGELARGSEFDPALHWSVKWLEIFLQVEDGGLALVDQPDRKTLVAATEELMVVLHQPRTDNVIEIYKALRELDTSAPPLHSATRVSPSGKPPDSDDCCRLFSTHGRLLFPEEAVHLDFSDHVWRIGGETVGAACDPRDPEASRMAMALAPHSKMHLLYEQATVQRQASLQYLMARTDVDVLADTFGRKPAGTRGPHANVAAPNNTVKPPSRASATAWLRPAAKVPNQSSLHDFMRATQPAADAPTTTTRAEGARERRVATDFPAASAASTTAPTAAAPAASVAMTPPVEGGQANDEQWWLKFDVSSFESPELGPEKALCQKFQFAIGHPWDRMSCKFYGGHRCAVCHTWGHGAVQCHDAGNQDFLDFRRNVEEHGVGLAAMMQGFLFDESLG